MASETETTPDAREIFDWDAEDWVPVAPDDVRIGSRPVDERLRRPAKESATMADAPNSTTTPEAEHLARAMAMVQKISRKIDTLLEPLQREMRINKWKPEYQAILWEAVMLEAKSRMEAATDGK